MSEFSPVTPDASASASGERAAESLIRVVKGSGTEEELAALVAVITEAYLVEEATAVAEKPPVSAWARTRRPIRTPLRRDIPWGRYHG